jgi:hypothetical protein
MHVDALEVASEDLSEILLAIDDVSWQMIQPCPGRVDQVDREELDAEEVIVHFARSARKVVVLQLDTRFSFVVILDNVAWRSKMLWETSITHGTSERLWDRPFETEAASFAIVVASVAWVLHASLGLCDCHGLHGTCSTCVVGIVRHRPLDGAIDVPELSTEHLVSPTSHRLKSSPMRRSFLPPEPLGWPLAPPPPALERLGVKAEASTQCCKELFACYTVVVLRMFFSR